MAKIKFVPSNCISIRANINTACEKNFAPTWYQKLQKRLSYLRARFYVVEAHRFNNFVPLRVCSDVISNEDLTFYLHFDPMFFGTHYSNSHFHLQKLCEIYCHWMQLGRQTEQRCIMNRFLTQN